MLQTMYLNGGMRIHFKIHLFQSHYLVGAAVAEAQYELSKASMVETALVSVQTALEQSLIP